LYAVAGGFLRVAEDYVQLGEVEHAADMATRMAILAG
jgi:hypothetical protein